MIIKYNGHIYQLIELVSEAIKYHGFVFVLKHTWLSQGQTSILGAILTVIFNK